MVCWNGVLHYVEDGTYREWHGKKLAIRRPSAAAIMLLGENG